MAEMMVYLKVDYSVVMLVLRKVDSLDAQLVDLLALRLVKMWDSLVMLLEVLLV